MTTKDKFTFESAYAKYPDCNFQASRYMDNRNLALMIVHEESGERIAIASVNPGKKLPDDRIAVKDYSENAGMVKALRNLGVIEDEPVDVIPSGFVVIPVFMLTESGKELFDGV